MGTDYWANSAFASTSRPGTSSPSPPSPVRPIPNYPLIPFSPIGQRPPSSAALPSFPPSSRLPSISPSGPSHQRPPPPSSSDRAVTTYTSLKACSPTSFHPGGRGLDFSGTPSNRTLDDEVSWGGASSDSYAPPPSLGRQVLSTRSSFPSFSFSRDAIPPDVGGRAAFCRLPVTYGVQSTGVLNDDDHIKTRTHCYDGRAYGTCMVDRSASWTCESRVGAPAKVVFGKGKRDINPRAWGRR